MLSAFPHFVCVGWSSEDWVKVIREVVTLVVAITALVKVFGLERKHVENSAKIDLNAVKVDATEKRLEEVKTDVRAVRSDLTTVAAISTPSTAPPRQAPIDFHEMYQQARDEKK